MKKLACKPGGMCPATGSSAKIMIEHFSRAGLAPGVGREEIHLVTQDAATDVVNEGHGAIGVDTLHDADVSQEIVVAPIAVAVEGVAEEDQISDCRHLVVMHEAAFPHGRVDGGHTASSGATCLEKIRIDSVPGEGGKHETGTVLSESTPVDVILRMVQHGSGLRSEGQVEIENVGTTGGRVKNFEMLTGRYEIVATTVEQRM